MSDSVIDSTTGAMLFSSGRPASVMYTCYDKEIRRRVHGTRHGKGQKDSVNAVQMMISCAFRRGRRPGMAGRSFKPYFAPTMLILYRARRQV